MARSKKSSKKSAKKVEEAKVQEAPQVEETEAPEVQEAPAETEAPVEAEAPEAEVEEAIAETMGETRTVAKILAGSKKDPEATLAALANHKEDHIRSLGKALQDYMEGMAGFPAVHPTKAASTQQKLYLAVKSVMEDDEYSRFEDGIKILLWWFKTYADSFASPNRVNAYMGQWHMGQRTKYSFATLNSFLILAANKGLKDIGKMVSVDNLTNAERSDLNERAGNNLRRLLGIQ